MLTQSISKYTDEPTKSKKRGKLHLVAGSDDHLQHIFNSHLDSVFKDGVIEEGSSVVVRRNGKTGIVINIEKEIKNIEWEGYKCKFIEVWLYADDGVFLFHPSELKVKEKDVPLYRSGRS